MEKRIITLILVVVVGIGAGVWIVVKEAEKPLLREIVRQQTAIVQTQNRIEQKLQGGSGGVGGEMVVKLMEKIDKLEDRLAKLEAGGAVAAAPRPAPQPAQPRPPQEDFNTVHEIPIAHTPIIGKKNALVTITEFVDFECPFCARFHPPVNQVLEAYPGKVNYLVKNFPLSFHPQAKPASKAAFAAAEQGKFQEMVDAILKDNRGLNDAKFEAFAKEIGLNVDKFKKDYKDKDAKWEKQIQADLALGTKVGVRGTPTFFINGRKTNARDFNAWKLEVEKELKKK